MDIRHVQMTRFLWEYAKWRCWVNNLWGDQVREDKKTE